MCFVRLQGRTWKGSASSGMRQSGRSKHCAACDLCNLNTGSNSGFGFESSSCSDSGSDSRLTAPAHGSRLTAPAHGSRLWLRLLLRLQSSPAPASASAPAPAPALAAITAHRWPESRRVGRRGQTAPHLSPLRHGSDRGDPARHRRRLRRATPAAAGCDLGGGECGASPRCGCHGELRSHGKGAGPARFLRGGRRGGRGRPVR